MVGQCRALNFRREPCRVRWIGRSGYCCFHDPVHPVVPGAVVWQRARQPEPVVLPRYDPDNLPSLRRELAVVQKFKAWAAEFDALDDERYSAAQFVEWVELELAPPARPKGDPEQVYTLVGAGALALG